MTYAFTSHCTIWNDLYEQMLDHAENIAYDESYIVKSTVC